MKKITVEQIELIPDDELRESILKFERWIEQRNNEYRKFPKRGRL